MLEICCGSYDDVINAYRAGARQVELNAALSLGGVSPRYEDVKRALFLPNLKVIAMVRPRPGGFMYSDQEFHSMLAEANDFLKKGVHGIAFGFLTEAGSIDAYQTKEMVDLIHSYHKEAVFHRAIDTVVDYELSIETLINMRVDRILTSGQAAKAIDGIDRLKKVQATYGHEIEFLMGSGVNDLNVVTLIEETGCNNIHSSCKSWIKEKGYRPNLAVDFSDFGSPQPGMQAQVDSLKVRDLISVLRSLGVKNDTQTELET